MTSVVVVINKELNVVSTVVGVYTSEYIAVLRLAKIEGFHLGELVSSLKERLEDIGYYFATREVQWKL